MPKLDRKTLIILQIVLIIFLIVIAFIVNVSSRRGQGEGGLLNPASPSQKTPNPLIDEEDQRKVEEDYQNKTRTKPKKYKFNFQLAPELKDKRSWLDKWSVFAITTCNLASSPTSLPVYQLKAKWGLDDAKKVATEYDLGKYAPAAEPQDGGTFNYHFSDPEAKSFLSLTEASGFYHYHKAIKDPPTKKITLLEAQKKSQDSLTKHNIGAGLILSSSSLVNNTYIFNYRKPLVTGLKLVDPIAIKTYVGPSICSVNQTDAASTLQVHIRQDSELVNLFKKTRDVLSTKTLSRQSLEKSLEDFKDNPIATVVNPETKKTPETGDVTIDEVILSYYDMGPVYSQTSYLPVYIAGGVVKGHPDTKAYIVIPAVSEKTLKDEGFLTETGAGKKTYESSQKLETFEEPPTLPPVGGAIGGCWGGIIDYNINCSINGAAICSTVGSLPATDDPLNVCKESCKNFSEVIEVKGTEGEKSACLQLLDKKNIKYEGKNGLYNQNFLKKGTSGRATCSFNACPC